MIKVSDTIQIPGLNEKKQESLYELSKNKYIRAFLKENHLSENVLTEYWIEFLDYSEDKKQCEGCRGLQYCLKENKGIIKELVYNGEIFLAMANCHYYNDSQEILNHFVIRNIKEDVLLTNIDTLLKNKPVEQMSALEQNAFAEILTYRKEPKEIGLFIHSENYRSQKTMLIAALMNALAKKGENIAFIHFPTYLVDLKASFQTEKAIDWTRLMDVPYLVLDGIGEENVTPYSRDEILLTVLSYRLLNNLPTFFTSFYGYKDLQKVYTIKKGDELKAKTLILKMKALCKEITLDE